MSTDRRDICLGGGLSGLTLGYLFGPDKITILEKNDYPGGLARTCDFNGFLFDLGGHRLLTEKERVNDFLENLLENELLCLDRKSIIYDRGKVFNYPPDISSVMKLGIWTSLKYLVSYLLGKLRYFKRRSFEDEAVWRFGRGMYSFYFQRYTKKVWGVDPSGLSSELVDTRISDLSLSKTISHVLRKNNALKTFTDVFLYPKKGMGQIIDALKSGQDLRLNSEVTGFVTEGDRIKSVVINGNEQIPCKRVISTMPLTRLIEILNPSDHEVMEAASRLKYRSLACVFLVIKKSQLTNVHWVYFPGKEIFGRLHEPKNWSMLMSPDRDMTGICCEIFCDEGDDMWNRKDEDILAGVIEDMPGLSYDAVDSGTVVRVPDAYPIYTLDYGKNRDKVIDYLSRYKNLYLAGRSGKYDYINMDDCIVTTMDLYERLCRDE